MINITFDPDGDLYVFDSAVKVIDDDVRNHTDAAVGRRYITAPKADMMYHAMRVLSEHYDGLSVHVVVNRERYHAVPNKKGEHEWVSARKLIEWVEEGNVENVVYTVCDKDVWDAVVTNLDANTALVVAEVLADDGGDE